MLLALIYMYWQVGTTNMTHWLIFSFPAQNKCGSGWPSLPVLRQMPMWPVHTWLPDAHVRPTAGSVILAGVLLKMGGYGFLRFSLPMFPLATDMFTELVLY